MQSSPVDLDFSVANHLQFHELENKYLAWAAVNKLHLDGLYTLLKDQKTPTEAQTKEGLRLKDQREALFEEFMTAFRETLPEIKQQLTIEKSRALPVDIAGVTRQFAGRIVDAAFEFKIHARLNGKVLEFFCSQDPTLAKLDLGSVPEDDLALIGAIPSKSSDAEADVDELDREQEVGNDSSKITKEMIAEFTDLPDPIELVEVSEILPAENKIKFRVKEPDSYNSQLLRYLVSVALTTFEGKQCTLETQLSIADPHLETDLLGQIKHLTANFMVESKVGLQEKPFTLKLQFATPYQDVWMFGRNECNQIEFQLVDQLAQETIEKNQEKDLYCGRWGKISFEALKIPDLKPVSVTCKSTSLCIVNNSQLVQWGMTLTRQEGTIQEIPADMFVRSGILVSSVAIGSTFCAASTIEGRVFTWGDNRVGQLGQGFFSPLVEHPTLVASLVGHFITDVKAGFSHCLALSDEGVAYSWGMKQAIVGSPVTNRFGDHVGFENVGVHQHTPQDISSRNIEAGETVRAIETGEFHLGLVTNKGKLFLWGENENSMFGEYPAANSVLPVRIQLPGPVKTFSLGYSHNVVEIEDQVSGDSTYLAWGANDYYQCGVTDTKPIRQPVISQALGSLKVASFSCAVDRTFIVDLDGNLFLVGRKFRDLTAQDSAKPVKIKEGVKKVRELNGTIVALN